MILLVSGQVGNAFLLPRYQGIVLVWKWSLVYVTMAVDGWGSQTFASFAVSIMLEAVTDTSHIQTDIEDSARHDGQVLDSEGTDAIED